MNKVFAKFIVALLLSAVVVVVPSVAPAVAGGDATSPSALGCHDKRIEYDLKFRGEKLSDIGTLMVYEQQVEGLNRWCVITKSGDNTLGKNKKMSIKLAWHEPGEKIVWPTSEGTTYDAGRYRNYAGSAYSTGREGECLAIKGFIKWRGKKYARTVRNVYCYD